MMYLRWAIGRQDHNHLILEKVRRMDWLIVFKQKQKDPTKSTIFNLSSCKCNQFGENIKWRGVGHVT